MQKAEYRRFNMRDVAPGDDYARDALGARRGATASVAAGEGKMPGPDPDRRRPGPAERGARRRWPDLGLHDIAVVGVAKGEERKPGLEQLVRRGRGGQSLTAAARPSRPAPDPADPRRGAPLRHHRPPRAARQGAHHLALEEIRGVGAQAAPEAARAFRRPAGRAWPRASTTLRGWRASAGRSPRTHLPASCTEPEMPAACPEPAATSSPGCGSSLIPLFVAVLLPARRTGSPSAARTSTAMCDLHRRRDHRLARRLPRAQAEPDVRVRRVPRPGGRQADGGRRR